MTTNYAAKATNDEIRNRFDQDVERFSNLETGQANLIDAALTMELCSEAAFHNNPNAKAVLDIGCGAGNYTLKLLAKIPDLNCTLNDLSGAMLQRAKERVTAKTTGAVTLIQEDMRNLRLPDCCFDVIFAAATFHHLRDDDDWEAVFHKVYKMLIPGGSIWISDVIVHDTPSIANLFNKRFEDYLENLGGPEYKQKVLDYVAYEDTPRSLNFQTDLLKKTGFRQVEVLHKNAYVAAFGAIK